MGWLLAIALGGSGVAIGCGPGEPPEQRLETAGETLEGARDDLEEARARRDAALRELSQARKALRRAESAVLSARERVERRATDVALFRAVQAALLEEPSLAEAAIAARVEGSEVTLEGEVAKTSLRERALEIARGTAGVAEVHDELEVVGEATASGS
jgi:osmotically-inducible protein OsmY